MRYFLVSAALLGALCMSHPVEAKGADPQAAIAAVLDDFHQAASKADEDRYFNHFAPEGIFLGTAPDERWTVAAFRAYAHPHFAKGTGWTYEPFDRHIVINGDTATFDEALRNAKYGLCRGNGSLRRVKGVWKIVQYSLSFPVPNDLALQVVGILKGAAP